MTNEEKQLLIKDLCARLPYGVIVDYKENEFEKPHWKITTIYPDTFDGWIGYHKRVGAGSESGSRPFKIGEIKPYLRPMSSITMEEQREYISVGRGMSPDNPSVLADWLEAHHFDYRIVPSTGKTLIESNLALEAPEGMYKTK